MEAPSLPHATTLRLYAVVADTPNAQASFVLSCVDGDCMPKTFIDKVAAERMARGLKERYPHQSYRVVPVELQQTNWTRIYTQPQGDSQ